MGISKQGGHFGYLIIDHSNSPGVSEEFVRRSGKNVPHAPEGKKFEADTFKCPHCDRVVIKNPLRVSDRHVCRKCMKVTCDSPGCLVDCIPISHVMDVVERQAYRDETQVEAAIANLRRDILG